MVIKVNKTARKYLVTTQVLIEAIQIKHGLHVSIADETTYMKAEEMQSHSFCIIYIFSHSRRG